MQLEIMLLEIVHHLPFTIEAKLRQSLGCARTLTFQFIQIHSGPINDAGLRIYFKEAPLTARNI